MARRDITGAVDFGYLEAFAGADRSLVEEVLIIFREQAAMWTPLLNAEAEGWRDAVHALKGASRSIGAGQLGDACERAETGEGGLDGVRSALDAALFDIAAYQHEQALKGLRGDAPIAQP